MPDLTSKPACSAFLTGGGECGRLIRAHDWGRTPLGPPEHWPGALKTLVALMLASRQPMFIVWGRERITLYNDSYAEILAGKHPAIGLPFHDMWPEIWDVDLEPIVTQAYAGASIHMDDIPLIMVRKGFPEETHFSFSYTPVRGDNGEVMGFFCPCAEITEQVLQDRRALLRAEIIGKLRDLQNPVSILNAALGPLGRYLRVDRVAYAEIDEAAGSGVIEHEWNSGAAPSHAGDYRLAEFGTRLGDLKRGKAIAIPDTSTDEIFVPTSFPIFSAWRGSRSVLIVPVIRDERLIAFWILAGAEPRYWHDRDIRLVEEIAELTWAAAEQARTEKALRESQTLLITVANSVHATVFAKDREGRFLMANERLEHFIGVPREAIIGRTDGEFFKPDHAAAIRSNDLEVMRRGEPMTVEELAVGPDGKEQVHLSVKSPLRDASGQITGVIGITTEITDQKRAERAVAESEARLRSLLDQLFAFVGVLDRDGVVRHANRAPLDAAGLGVADVIGKRFDETYWWSYDHRVQEQLRAAMGRAAEGESVRYDVPVRMANGRLMAIDFQIAPMKDETGRIVGLIPSAIDIDTRVRAEKALAESEARFRGTFENAAVGIAHVGMGGKLLRVNDKLCEVFGCSREELLSKTFQDLTHPDDLDTDLKLFEPMMRDEGPGYQIEKRYLRKNGESIWANLTTSLQRDPEGKPLYGIAIVEDISARKRGEEHRQLLIGELNHRVKNMLAIIQSLASQTFRGDCPPEKMMQAFQARLTALAAAHNLLTQTEWEDASLGRVARATITATCARSDRVCLNGPHVPLEPNKAVTVAMAVHELCTNAVKYGALSNEEGHVELSWSRKPGQDQGVTLVWQELGGPPVRAPTGRGFGSRMIEQALAYELDGQVTMEFRPEGLLCIIEGTLPDPHPTA